ncbi:MAG TPA: acyl carrier protein [Opitutaceae bacterium]|nr:acyl carrier protein [Opitutaceae bacterium]
MTQQEIEQKVKEIISRKFNAAPEKIQPETRLAEDLGVDSFGAVELMFEVEEAFGLKIPDSDIEHVRTVNDVVVYLATWLDKTAPK